MATYLLGGCTDHTEKSPARGRAPVLMPTGWWTEPAAVSLSSGRGIYLERGIESGRKWRGSPSNCIALVEAGSPSAYWRAGRVGTRPHAGNGRRGRDAHNRLEVAVESART